MRGSRFLWQIWGVLGFTLVISSLVFGVFVADQVKRDAISRIEQGLFNQALALTPAMSDILEKGELMAPDALNRLIPGVTARVTLIDSDGQVLADSLKPAELMDNHAGRPEVLASSTASFGVSSRFSDTLGLSMHYLAVQVRNPTGRHGFLRLAVPLTTIEEQLATLQNRIFMSAAGVGLLFLLIGYFLAYRLTNPIAKMTEIAANIAKGDYHLRLPSDREDEIGQLSVVINELALGAQERIDELTENRNTLASVLAGLAEGVVAVDLDQRVLHINDAALTMLGLNTNQVLQKKFEEVPTAREIRQVLETSIKEQSGMSATVSLGDRTFDCSCVLMREEDRVGSGAILVLEDVTERLRLEKVRSDFVANASHELKTPISAIRGLIETIIDDPEMPADVFSRFIERIRQQTIRLDKIVQDLLHLSRFDSSDQERMVERVDLAGVVRQVYQAKTFDASDAGVDLSLDLQTETLEVRGDAEALNQLVTNLVDNAIKYTSDDGFVKVRLLTVGTMALLEVEDNGPGISKDEQQRIFERFYRIDRARSRELGGTGLGLSIVKHIAAAHNGSVAVESVVGKGSTFCVRIPLV